MKILVECYADELFIRALLGNKDRDARIIHSVGRSRIIKKIHACSENIKAVIDEDPNSYKDRRLNSYQMLLNNNYIIVYKTKNSILVVLRPDLEGFLLRLANTLNINVKKFGLPSNAELHRITGNTNIKTNTNFKAFLQNVMAANNPVISSPDILLPDILKV
ncbi:MAG: hypothetical protein QXD90_00025 [Candidatus Nitrosocaldus sp.]